MGKGSKANTYIYTYRKTYYGEGVQEFIHTTYVHTRGRKKNNKSEKKRNAKRGLTQSISIKYYIEKFTQENALGYSIVNNLQHEECGCYAPDDDI